MLSVAVQKDPMEYKNKIIGSLTARNLACALIAIVVSVGIAAYCYFLINIPIDISMFIIILVSLPIWAAGFWHPYGMNLEEFAPLWFKFYFGDNVVIYKSSDQLSIHKEWGPIAEAKERKEKRGYRVDKDYKMLCKRPDFEAYDIDAGAAQYPSFDKQESNNKESLEKTTAFPVVSQAQDKSQIVNNVAHVAEQPKKETTCAVVPEEIDIGQFRDFGLQKLNSVEELSDIEREFFVSQIQNQCNTTVDVENVISRASEVVATRIKQQGSVDKYDKDFSGFDA